jgi:hypothetical protein
MKAMRLCTAGAIAALALAASGPAGAESSGGASCVGQFASNQATTTGEEFGDKNSNAAQLDQLHPFGQTSVSTLAQAPSYHCPSVP